MKKIISICIAGLFLLIGVTAGIEAGINSHSTKDPLEHTSVVLTADGGSLGYHKRHIGRLWLPYKALQFNFDKPDNVTLIIDEVEQNLEFPVYMFFREFFGLGPSILKRRLFDDTSIYLKGVCKEAVIIPYDVFRDYIYEQSLFDVTEVVDFGQTAYGLASADFNDDGSMDFAASSATVPWTKSTISLFINNQNGSFTQNDVYNIFESLRYIEDLNAADYDNDGDIDILYTHSEAIDYWKVNGTGKILFNNGDTSFDKETEVFRHGPGTPYEHGNRINPQVTSADYDMDGDIDFVVGDNSGMIEFYENDGTGGFTSRGVLHDYGQLSWGLASGDYDGDGDIDLLVSAESADFHGAIYFKSNQLIESNQSLVFNEDAGEPLLYIQGISGVASVELFDVDQDNDLDFIAGISDEVYLCLHEHDTIDIHFLGSLPENYEGYSDHLHLGAITNGDYNNDDKQDIILGGVQGVIRYCENNFGFLPPFRPYIQQPKEFTPHTMLEFGFMTTDINIENISYYVDWGDKTNSGWVGPFPSGEPIMLSHSWNETRSYWVKAKARDATGLESLWKEYVLILHDPESNDATDVDILLKQDSISCSSQDVRGLRQQRQMHCIFDTPFFTSSNPFQLYNKPINKIYKT